MLRLIEHPGHSALLHVPPSSQAVVSWNTYEPEGSIALTAHRNDGSVSEPLPFVHWSPEERSSLGGADALARVEVDVLRSDVPLAAVGIASAGELEAVAVSVPPDAGNHVMARTHAAELDVPELSQYLAEHPEQSGWCSAASLAMLLTYHGIPSEVDDVAAAVMDTAYGGTGNWSFNAAYAGACGLRGAAAYLDGMDHVAAFIEAGLPVAISIGWQAGELPGAPFEHSFGHLLVVRGLDSTAVAVNDPAQPAVRTRYPRAELDARFRAHGGVAYLIAPCERTAELVALANAS